MAKPRSVQLLSPTEGFVETSTLNIAPGVFVNPNALANAEPQIRDLQIAANAFGLRLHFLNVSSEDDAKTAFETLVGERIPEDTGVAGWVVSAGQPVVIEDVTQDPRFAGDVAATTGYVPKGLMAAPLIGDGAVLGVLSVLDRPKRAGFSLMEMDLFGLFANQAAIAIESGRAKTADGRLAELEARLDSLDAERREHAEALINALTELL